MTTRDHIIRKGDELIRGRGYHGFSFTDISKDMGIKNASIHYYFPSKTDLGIAVVQKHIDDLDKLMLSVAGKTCIVQLEAFLSIYDHTRKGNRICVVGALASTLPTIDASLGKELKIMSDKIIQWLTAILERGKEEGVFNFHVPVRTRALMLASTMLASVQLVRLTGAKDFEKIKDGVIAELNHTGL